MAWALDRIALCAIVVLTGLLGTACVSLHDDVFRSRIPGEEGSLYSVLKERVTGRVPLATPDGAAKSVAALFPDSVVARIMHDALLAYSPLGALAKDTKVTAACLGAQGEKGLEAAVDHAVRDVKQAKVRLGHIDEFLKEVVALHRAREGGPGLVLLPIQIAPPKDPTKPDGLTLLHFLGGYLVAYANGSFVDRNGARVTAPTVGAGTMSIGNDTITAFVSVVGEAITDHFFYRYRKCIEYPIVLGKKADGAPLWLTVGGGMPTLAAFSASTKRPRRTRFRRAWKVSSSKSRTTTVPAASVRGS
ncbi:MAG TPA: hypothetical protein VJX92_22140 [Methylomirabilota bacterium]|nr:hypothetical protein [Methylomirabilota bacterium]